MLYTVEKPQSEVFWKDQQKACVLTSAVAMFFLFFVFPLFTFDVSFIILISFVSDDNIEQTRVIYKLDSDIQNSCKHTMRSIAIKDMEGEKKGSVAPHRRQINDDLSDAANTTDSDAGNDEYSNDEESDEDIFVNAEEIIGNSKENIKGNGESNNNDNEDDNEEDDDVDDDGDIDKAIAKADKPKQKKPSRRNRQVINQINNINTFDELQLMIRKSFQEVQTTVAVHKRQLSIMKGIMLKAHSLRVSDEFNDFFSKMLNKILPAKKNIKAANRVVKFVSSFFLMMNPANFKEDDENYGKTIEQIDDIYSIFIEKLLKYLVKGLDAMNSSVRYRVCHLLSHLIGNCGGIDEEMYELLSDELTARIYDKDAAVRTKAITALACFQNDDNTSLSLAGKKIRFIMQNDLNNEVRRTCLKNIEKNKYTEPYIVERARDVDKVNRRIVFSKILPSFDNISSINSENRTRLLGWGLRDRDESVRKAASEWLTETWMRDSDNDLTDFLENLNVIENDISDTAVRALLDKKPEIVESLNLEPDFYENLTPSLSLMIRVVFEYCQDNNKDDIIDKLFPVATDFAMLFAKYFKLRTDNLLKISENREKLEQDPNHAIQLGIIDPDEYNYIIMQLLKIAVDYDYSDEFGRSKMYSILRSTLSNNTVTEPILPLLMECLRKLAINERDFCQMTVEIINDLRDTEYERIMALKREEEERKLQEEAEYARNKRRRRKGANVSQSEDEDDVAAADEVAKINAKVESLLREPSDEEEEDSDYDEYHSAMNDMSRQSIYEANKSIQEQIDQVSILSPGIITDCLTITKCMLQYVFSPLKENMLLISLLDNFIVPCVNQRSEVAVRELALICHGLCGLLDKEVAISTMVVAGIFVTRSDHESFVVAGLKVIGDLLTAHGISILQSDNQRSIDSMAVAKVFYRTLKDDSKPEAQAVVAVTLFKLFLCDVIDDDELFETTLLTYFNPKVNKNLPLKQCLSFCIPTYAFSHEKHQELIASIVYDTVERLYKDWSNIVELNRELEVKKPVTPTYIIEHLVYWTDPTVRASISEDEVKVSTIHLDVGVHLMKLLRKYDYQNKTHKILYKPIIKALTTLVFTEYADIEKLRAFKECFDDDNLCQGDLDIVLNSDTVTKNYFLKAHTYIMECLGAAEKMEKERLEKEEKEETTVKNEEKEGEDDVVESNVNGIVIDQDDLEEKSIVKEEKNDNDDDIEGDFEDNMVHAAAQSSMVIEENSEANSEADESKTVTTGLEENELDLESDPNVGVDGEDEDSDLSIEIVEMKASKALPRKEEIRVTTEKDVVIKKEKGIVVKLEKVTGRVNKPEHHSNKTKKHRKAPVSSPPFNPDTSEIILLDSD